MRIGEVARRAGVTTKAVRYYESLGLLAPGRLANGYRNYGEHDVRLVRQIRELGELGIPAGRSRPFLDCLAAGHGNADDCPASLATYRHAIDELTRRIDELTTRRAALREQLARAAHRGDVDSQAETVRQAGTEHPPSADDSPAPAGGSSGELPGTPMPGLPLRDTDGGRTRLDTLGKGRTVVYVYPLTGSPQVDLPDGWDTIPGARGCTAEACGFRDHHRELLAAGAAGVFGLSSQHTDYQRELVERLALPFPMLSDPTHSLNRALGLPTFRAGGLRLYERLTLIVREGFVEHCLPPGLRAARARRAGGGLDPREQSLGEPSRPWLVEVRPHAAERMAAARCGRVRGDGTSADYERSSTTVIAAAGHSVAASRTCACRSVVGESSSRNATPSSSRWSKVSGALMTHCPAPMHFSSSISILIVPPVRDVVGPVLRRLGRRPC
ncbi:Peroxiredoxin [Actinopolyspora mzabensis]|uniref:Peroxiredoxin n=1 Tax=Actinopolyspora mzabensis TaxID=995066 RepID=A0A1G8YAM4_ACTMZ|nr:Peroxiredoxin [Actinopolyspora mzabensis]